MSFLPPTQRHMFLVQWSQASKPVNCAPNPAPPLIIAVIDHLEWGRAIARGVRRRFNFVKDSQEELELISTAHLAIVELARRFDPAKMHSKSDPWDAFRGWAGIEVRCRCRREARRLRNGGTYHTRREKMGEALVVQRLMKGPHLIDPRSLVDPHDLDPE